VFEAFFRGDDVALIDIDDPAPVRSMRHKRRMHAVTSKKDNGARTALGHSRNNRIGGVQNGITGRRDVLDDDALNDGKIFHRRNIVQSQVVALSDIRDDGDVASIKAQAFAQNASTRRFKYGGINVGMQEHVSRAARTAAISRIDALSFDIDAVRRRHARPVSVSRKDVLNEPDGRRLPVCAGDGDDGNTSVITRIGKHHRNHRLSDRTPFTKRWSKMHTQARRCIHLDDSAALIFERTQNRLTDDVDTAYIKADGMCGGDG